MRTGDMIANIIYDLTWIGLVTASFFVDRNSTFNHMILGACLLKVSEMIMNFLFKREALKVKNK